jgi:hypothetical protein
MLQPTFASFVTMSWHSITFLNCLNGGGCRGNMHFFSFTTLIKREKLLRNRQNHFTEAVRLGNWASKWNMKFNVAN